MAGSYCLVVQFGAEAALVRLLYFGPEKIGGPRKARL